MFSFAPYLSDTHPKPSRPSQGDTQSLPAIRREPIPRGVEPITQANPSPRRPVIPGGRCLRAVAVVVGNVWMGRVNTRQI